MNSKTLRDVHHVTEDPVRSLLHSGSNGDGADGAHQVGMQQQDVGCALDRRHDVGLIQNFGLYTQTYAFRRRLAAADQNDSLFFSCKFAYMLSGQFTNSAP